MLRTLAHKAVRSLLLKHRIITEDEDLNTQRLVRELGKARARGYLTRRELEKICRWKSARAIHLVRANGSAHVRAMTELALQTRSEKRRIEALTALKGVSLPMASAILTLLYPNRYGVIDIRVWQLLYRVRAVTGRPGGIGFTFEHWDQFLAIIRQFAKEFQTSPRAIELTLFLAHQSQQTGTLYRKGLEKR